MPHILIAGKLHPSGLALLEASPGVTYTHVEEISEASYQAHLDNADGMVIRTQPMTAASGISATMINALKITADRIADVGLASCIRFSAASCG